MKRLTLERAECWDVTDELEQRFRVVFWDTHQQCRWGKQRMAVAIFTPGIGKDRWQLAFRSSRFYPAPSISCDGPDAARQAVDLACFYNRAELMGNTTAHEISESDEGAWLS